MECLEIHRQAMHIYQDGLVARFHKNDTEYKELIEKAFSMEKEAVKKFIEGSHNKNIFTGCLIFSSTISMGMELENKKSDCLELLDLILKENDLPDFFYFEFVNIKNKLLEH